ncbi:PREDICTED: probable 2-oxoglutarate-dependent dioxygenase AOP1.2 [Camelina sativa]|uniref:Probable 2-oxoglutarate-dependent dioxygenase AOP1.2 n=1 Tax=Camelina sativa TaxID=90675 RepID=A0ABM1RC28_CAMSA|nr:PREDICTED: probable 2-oxoglutarate-dependent dioxygenase AOP1.2 [Camelina sativa]
MESFGIYENYIDEHLKSTKCLMRMMKYNGVDETEEGLGMEAHTDRNVLTIVCLNDVADGGLEVKTKDGSHWIEANPLKILHSSSLGEVLLNGRVQSAVHRVVRMGTETRYSSGLFSMPNTEDLISAPEEMVDPEYPRLFNPFDFEAYYKFTCEGSGRRDLSGLKTYCSLLK